MLLMSPPYGGDWARDRRPFVYPLPQQRAMTLTAFRRPINRRSEQSATGVFAQGNAVSSYLGTGVEQPNSYFFPEGPDPIEEPPSLSNSDMETTLAKGDTAEHDVVKVPTKNPTKEVTCFFLE